MGISKVLDIHKSYILNFVNEILTGRCAESFKHYFQYKRDYPRAIEYILKILDWFSVDTMDYITMFRSRLVELAMWDIYMLCKECYAAWWLRDDKSQASIRRDILQDPQNIRRVAPEGLLNKWFNLSNITSMTMHTNVIDVYRGNTWHYYHGSSKLIFQ